MTGQFARFCAVGATNTLITVLVFWLLQRSGVPYAPASAAAFAAGAANGFVLNGAWTFRRRGRPLAYVAVQGVGLALDVGLIAAAVRGLGAPHLAAQVAVLPVVTTTTFVLSRRLVFAGSGTSLWRRWAASSRPSSPASQA